MIDRLATTNAEIEIERHTYVCDGHEYTDYMSINIKHQTQFEHFKTLVNRALNVWPDAPPELKEFGDLLLEGKILQDYRSQV